MNSETLKKLKGVSVATLCTALYKRGLSRQFIQNVHPVGGAAQHARLGNMVGPAYTLRYIPAREDLNPLSVFENRSHPQIGRAHV